MAGQGQSENWTEVFPLETPKTGEIIKIYSNAKTTSSLFPPGHIFKIPAFLLGSSMDILCVPEDVNE